MTEKKSLVYLILSSIFLITGLAGFYFKSLIFFLGSDNPYAIGFGCLIISMAFLLKYLRYSETLTSLPLWIETIIGIILISLTIEFNSVNDSRIQSIIRPLTGKFYYIFEPIIFWIGAVVLFSSLVGIINRYILKYFKNS